jgi:hypothetical protein
MQLPTWRVVSGVIHNSTVSSPEEATVVVISVGGVAVYSILPLDSMDIPLLLFM